MDVDKAPGSYINPIIALVEELRPRNGLEVGFGWFGFSANAYLDHCSGNLTSMDKEDWRGYASKLVNKNPRFKFLHGRSEEILKNLDEKYDYVYIDGDHRYEGSLSDMKLCVPLVEVGGYVVLDDCGYNLTAGVDISDGGAVYDGPFGAGKAADEVFENKDWERYEPPMPLANDGRVYWRVR